MTLRSRLTLSYVSFFAIALIALDIGLYLIARQALINSIDNELQLGAQLVQQDFTDSNEALLAYFGERRKLLVSVSGFGATNLGAQVFKQDGTLFTGSPNLSETLPADQALLTKAFDRVSSVLTVDAGEVRLRELYTPLIFRDRVVGVLQIVRSMKETELALKLLFYALLGGGLVVLLAAARGGAWLTRAAFRPIDEVTHTAQGIVRAEDLSRRVPVPPAQDELQRLTITINDLLARLEALFSAQRRFVADVSHELRTPLAAMQGNLEVLDRGAARDPGLLAESLADMRREVARLIRMANDLLLLAQSEAGVQLRREPVELDTLLLEVHRELRPLADGIQLRIGEEDQIVVQGDRDRIKQALLNLGVNALQHTPPGGSVTLALARADGKAALTVADSGAGIGSDDLPHIFDRFYRADPSRSRNRGGAGLGLAIVKWIADAHGGQVEVTSTPGSGSRFSLLLPFDEPLEYELRSLQLIHNTPHHANE
ncbi:MAG: HAMP domain-containing protein [Kouleothrix sp.]|nr:HAMP domain-containing protein [Kouleothrix sp.]